MTLPSSDETPSSPKARSNRMEIRAAASGTFGSALEFFDFAIYGALAASLFPQLFFSDLGSSGALIASFATFGVGFVARPLGAIVFGHLGDRFGRRPVLYITLAAMGLASFIIGLLPTGQGAAVASILVALRFIQGFSLGGEHAGNQLMVMEHGRGNRRGLLGSFVAVGSPISQVVANLTLVVLTSVLSTQQWETWGWRIPFLASLAIVAIAAFIRVKLTETPAFVANQGEDEAQPSTRPKALGIRVVLTQPRQVIQLVFLWGGFSLCFYLTAVYGLTLLTSQGDLATDVTFTILLIANAISIPACLAGGFLSDRVGRKRTIIGAQIGCAIGITLLFVLAPTGSVLPIAIAITLGLSSIQVAAGTQPAFFAERFPTESRFSGVAISHTFANLLFAAPAPMVATALASAGGNQAVMWFALGAMGLSAISIATISDRTGVNLTAVTAEGTTPVITPARNPLETQA